MAEFTVTVHDSDVKLLEEIAQHDWRTAPMQLSAMIERDLAAARARANTAPRTTSRRAPARNNGAIRVEV